MAAGESGIRSRSVHERVAEASSSRYVCATTQSESCFVYFNLIVTAIRAATTVLKVSPASLFIVSSLLVLICVCVQQIAKSYICYNL